jgi:hypothetical protein
VLPDPAKPGFLARGRLADWLRAGQALDRLLLHAATRWVFASCSRSRSSLHDCVPQMLLQFDRANTAAATARRPADKLIDRGCPAPAEP